MSANKCVRRFGKRLLFVLALCLLFHAPGVLNAQEERQGLLYSVGRWNTLSVRFAHYSESTDDRDFSRGEWRNMSLGAILGGDDGVQRVHFTASRLTPALLCETRADTYRLFTGGKNRISNRSKFYTKSGKNNQAWPPFETRQLRVGGVAIPSADGVRTVDFCPLYAPAAPELGVGASAVSAVSETDIEMELEDALYDGLSEPWLLVWFGQRDEEFNALQTLFGPARKGPSGNEAGDWSFAEFADLPQLLIFERPYAKIEFDDGALRVRFDGAAGKMVVVSLNGGAFLKPEETIKWKHGLPDDITERCGMLAKTFRCYPTDVEEDFEVKGDSITIRNTFKYAELSGGENTRHAPLPPTLALAVQYGFPAQIEGQVVDLAAPTLSGPSRVVMNSDVLTYTLPGVLRYLRQPPAQAKSMADAPKPLLDRLENEIEKVLDAGHLAPVNARDDGCVWTRPLDTPAALCEAFPFVSPALQGRIMEYCRKEMAEFSPFKYAHLNVCLREGVDRATGKQLTVTLEQLEARAKYFGEEPRSGPVPVDTFARAQYYTESETWWVRAPQGPDGYTLYQAWQYLDASNDTKWLSENIDSIGSLYTRLMATQDWALMRPFESTKSVNEAEIVTPRGRGGVWDRNQMFAAHVAMGRMASMAGVKEEFQPLEDLMGAKEMVAYFAAYKLPRFLYDAGFIRADGRDLLPWYLGTGRTATHAVNLAPVAWMSADDDVRWVVRWGLDGAVVDSVNYCFSSRVELYCDLTRETACFIRDYLKSDYGRYQARIDHRGPAWYLRKHEKFMGSEQFRQDIETIGSIFQARAWIGRETPEQLLYYLSPPRYQIGDLSYIRSLSALCSAY